MASNHTIYVDHPSTDDDRRAQLHDGQIHVLAPTEHSRALCDFAAELIAEAFAPLDPLTAQHEMPVERFVEIFAPLKPRYMHHQVTRRLLRQILEGAGCDPEQTYLDPPKLRGVTSDAYLEAGVGYVHPAHRDSWWSAPLAQLNWWMPIHPIETTRALAFHPRYWSEPVPNGSERFNYYEWNAVGRANAARHLHRDTRNQPGPPADLDPTPEVRLVVPPGGIVLFSGSQLHSTVPNTSGVTRFSTDFRTVHAGDLRAGRGAPNVDSRPQGTALRDFRRIADDAAMPADLVASYDSGPVPENGVLVFEPSPEGTS